MVPARYIFAGIRTILALQIFYIDTFLHEDVGPVHSYENASSYTLLVITRALNWIPNWISTVSIILQISDIYWNLFL